MIQSIGYLEDTTFEDKAMKRRFKKVLYFPKFTNPATHFLENTKSIKYEKIE